MATFTLIVMSLCWAVLLVLNLWVFQKSKGRGNLLMLVGSAVMLLVWFINLVATIASSFVIFWLPILGMLAFTAGFFLSVQPMVQAQIDQLKQKLHDVTSEKKEAEGGGGDA